MIFEMLYFFFFISIISHGHINNRWANQFLRTTRLIHQIFRYIRMRKIHKKNLQIKIKSQISLHPDLDKLIILMR